MKHNIKKLIPAAALLLGMGMASCTSDLDVTPISPKVDTEYDAEGLFNKCYANFAMAGIGDGSSGDGNCDVAGYSDAGMTNLIRQMWNSNELTTDEAICSWGDDGIPQFNFNTYDASEPMTKAYFARLTLGISYCNHYLSIASDHDATMTAEVRFLRALQYYLLMDAFGNIPFATSVSKPIQISRAEAYEWLVDELLEIEPSLGEAGGKKSTNVRYGHADKGACWMLLARLYLNAEVYTGTAQWEKAAEYAQKVMNGGYTLCTTPSTISAGGQTHTWSAYQKLFMGDNGESDAALEAVFPIIQDSRTTTSYGSTLFLIASCFSEDMCANPLDPNGYNGTTAHWDGNRARPELIKKFFESGNVPEGKLCYEMPALAGDDRAIFCGDGRTLDIDEYSTYKQGFGVGKFINYKSDGSASYDPQFADTDWFLFRLAEAYLTYAEATARQNGGRATANGINAINALRSRANATSKAGYSLDDILDEWSREFYFEGRRRTDLIRFGKYGGDTDYVWQWKGGQKSGRNFNAYMNIFAIPTNELTSNGNLTQNPGY